MPTPAMGLPAWKVGAQLRRVAPQAGLVEHLLSPCLEGRGSIATRSRRKGPSGRNHVSLPGRAGLNCDMKPSMTGQKKLSGLPARKGGAQLRHSPRKVGSQGRFARRLPARKGGAQFRPPDEGVEPQRQCCLPARKGGAQLRLLQRPRQHDSVVGDVSQRGRAGLNYDNPHGIGHVERVGGGLPTWKGGAQLRLAAEEPLQDRRVVSPSPEGRGSILTLSRAPC